MKQLASTHSSVIGGCYPHHFVTIDDNTTPDQARALLSNNAILKPAQEVKVAVLTFQQAPKGICPTFFLCGPPQTTDEVNDFNGAIISACAEFCNSRRTIKLVSCWVLLIASLFNHQSVSFSMERSITASAQREIKKTQELEVPSFHWGILLCQYWQLCV